MLANVFWASQCKDWDELFLWSNRVRDATRTFNELSERFRLASSRTRNPHVLKRDVDLVFPMQAGPLMCECWDRGMFSSYGCTDPDWYLLSTCDSKVAPLLSWFAFIRWQLAPQHKIRFRADWGKQFFPQIDRVRRDSYSQTSLRKAICDDPRESTVWQLDVSADVQATACTILADELAQVVEVTKRRLRELPIPVDANDRVECDAPATGSKKIHARSPSGAGEVQISLHTEPFVVEIDGTPYPLSGKEDKKTKVMEFIQALIDAKGGPISATDHEIRTRDIERQHEAIRDLIGAYAKPGSGYRIPLAR